MQHFCHFETFFNPTGMGHVRDRQLFLFFYVILSSFLLPGFLANRQFPLRVEVRGRNLVAPEGVGGVGVAPPPREQTRLTLSGMQYIGLN